MFSQIFFRLPYAISFFNSYVNQAGAEFVDLFFVQLKLSQALAAIGSPGSTKKFEDGCAARN